MPEPKRPLKVFLCHAHADRDAVRGLYSRLTQDGVDAWLDKEKLLPGQDWELEIKKAVREADVVVVCLSKQFNQAGFRQKEVRLALDTAMEKPEGEIFIIPARLEECDTLESLRKWHWVDLFEDSGYEMLMRALRARANRIGATLQIKRVWLPKITSPRLTIEKTVDEKKSVKFGVYKETPEKKELEVDNDKAEHELFEKVAYKKVRGEIAENNKRPIAKQPVVHKVVFRKMVSNLFAAIKRMVFKSLPSLRAIAFIGIAIALLWIGGWAVSPFYSLVQKMPVVSTPIVTRTPDLRPRASCSYIIKNDDTLYGVALELGLGYDGYKKAFCAPESKSCNLSNPESVTRGWIIIFPDAIEENCINNGGGIVSTPTSVGAVQTHQVDQTSIGTPRIELSPTPSITSIGLLPTEITDAKGVSMVLVPAGEFEMGTNDVSAFTDDDENPAVSVYVASFYLDKHEVTNKLYSECADTNVCKLPTNTIHYKNPLYESHPVVYVDWYMARTYCEEWRGERLPTEAEWEKAAQNHSSGGDTCDKVNYQGKFGKDLCVGDTTPVGNYLPQGEYGLYDMLGNVWEWTSSLYKPYPYNSLDGREDLAVYGYRVLRGGAWNYTHPGSGLQSIDRLGKHPALQDWSYGFRCAKDANP